MNQLEPFAKVRSTSSLARQLSKIRELVETVEAAGFLTLDEQAKILGLPRSTAWTIRRGSHKASGLSASIINRMLAAPTLPPLVRAKILEYVQEKAAGLYGGSRSQCRRFASRLSVDVLRETPDQRGRCDHLRLIIRRSAVKSQRQAGADGLLSSGGRKCPAGDTVLRRKGRR